jgi:multidrug efflux system outer membrane protein
MRRLAILLLFVAGCQIGPDYQRPEVEPLKGYRGAAATREAQSFGDLPRVEVFADEELRKLIETALAKNWDVLIAAERVRQARERYTVSRSFLYPSVDATGNLGGAKPGEQATDVEDDRWTGSVGVAMAWEIDLWGRIQRSNEAAWAEILATEEARNGVLQSLVAEVANQYLDLRELDLELEIARRTLATREESRTLVTRRETGGVASLMDVRQSEVLVTSAAAEIPDIERRIVQRENGIRFLLRATRARCPGGAR